LLAIEGAITLLETNWDTCIERALPNHLGRIEALISDADALGKRGPVVSKLHGCVTRPDTLLISSTQLDAPLTWVTDQVRNHLAASTVVFVGIGDVADYVQERLTMAVSLLPSLPSIFVATPTIASGWDDSVWADVLPELSEDNKIEQSADEFLDELCRAFVKLPLMQVAQLESALPIQGGVSALNASCLDGMTATEFLMWLRQSAPDWEAGAGVLQSRECERALLALAVLARTGTGVGWVDKNQGWLSTPIGEVALLIADNRPAAAAEAEGRWRAAHGHGLGWTGDTTFICEGYIGGLPKEEVLAVDLIAEPESESIVDGPSGGQVRFVTAESVILGEVGSP
jgi:hypothetical protein